VSASAIATQLDPNWLCCERNTHGRAALIREKRKKARNRAPNAFKFPFDFETLEKKGPPVKNIVEW
jgi:hypothetical protein